MRKTKIFIVLATVLCMVLGCVSAETKNLSCRVTIDRDSIFYEDESLTADVDYSNLYVNVIKYKNKQWTLLYSGKLGNYAG